jgi:hypothetical protein
VIMAPPIIIEVQRARGGWVATEDNWISPVYPKKAHALNHARVRARFRHGEIRIHDNKGSIEHTVLFFPNREKERR